MSELKEFVFRAQVRALYRKFLRVAGQAPEGARGELRTQIRHEFDNQRQVADPYQKKFLLSDGRNRLKQLSEMLGMQQ